MVKHSADIKVDTKLKSSGTNGWPKLWDFLLNDLIDEELKNKDKYEVQNRRRKILQNK